MSNSSCQYHVETATFFCLCAPNPVFLCNDCAKKHAGHDLYPENQYHFYYGGLNKNPAELKRRKDILDRSETFLEKLKNRQVAVQAAAKDLIKKAIEHYEKLLNATDDGFDSLQKTLLSETRDLLIKPKPKMSPITQALHARLNSPTEEIERRLVHIPEEETLRKFAERCELACSRTSELWQMDYKKEALNALTGQPQIQQEAEHPALALLRESQAQCEALSRDKDELRQQLSTQANQWREDTDTLNQQLDLETTRHKATTAELEKTRAIGKFAMFLIVCLVAWIVLATQGTQVSQSPAEPWTAGLPENSQSGLSQTLQQSEWPGLLNFSAVDRECKNQYEKLGPYQGLELDLTLVWRHLVNTAENYTGQVNSQQEKHGWGRNVYSEGYIYEGSWRNGTREGQGRFIDSDGNIYIGGWVKGKRNGMGTKLYHDNSEYIGTWVNNEKQGIGSMKSGNTTQWRGDQMFGEWFLDKLYGLGVYFYGNGTIVAGNFKLYKVDGKAVAWYPDGKMCFGNWESDKLSGTGTCLYPDGTVYTGQWVNGMKSGQGTFTHPGKSEKGVWKNDGLILRR